MVRKLLRFFRGYLQVEIRGNALERLINQINGIGIVCWDVQRVEKDFYLAKLYSSDFKQLRRIFRKRRCWIKIRDKHGFPFLFNKIMARKFLVMGTALFLFIFYIGSSFLFFIEIEGVENISEEKISAILFQNGIRRGIMKKAVDAEALEKILLKQVPEIAWVDVRWQGTCLYLDIVEKKIVEEVGAGDIVAARDGIIQEVIVLKGMAVVKEGDTVTSGQPLIVAAAGQKNARGIVKAYVWYKGEAKMQFQDQELIYTGREKTYWGFKVGQEIVWLPPYQEYFQNYQKRRETKGFSIWRNIFFPIELIKEEHREVKILKREYTRENALFLAKEKALQEIIPHLSPGAIILDIKVEEISQQAKIEVLVKVLENIARLDY